MALFRGKSGRVGRRAGRVAFVAALATGVTLAGTPAFAASADDWKIVAHRGGYENGVQHSLRLLTEMVGLHPDAVEIDVQYTRDRVPIIFHGDDELSRLTTNCSGLISNQKWKSLKDCVLRNPFGPEYDNQKLMSLNSTLKFITRNTSKRFQVFLHIKVASKDAAKKIANVVERWDLDKHVVVISNSRSMLHHLKKRGLRKQGLVFNDPGYFNERWLRKYKFLIPYNVSLNNAVLDDLKRRQRVLPVENHPHALTELNKLDIDGVLANDLPSALILAGRLAGTNSADHEQGIPVGGPARTTGPMDF